jgi:hypothetical protein
MGQTATIERSPDLYTITLPPGMLTCVNAAGAMRLLNRGRVTIWNYVNANRLRSFSIAGNIAIPLVDIATILGLTETQVYNVAIACRLPLWQIYPEGG